MANNKRSALPRRVKPANNTSDRANTSRSDGASLAMGSTEYRERVADLKGVDEQLQERQKLESAGFLSCDDKSFSDKRREQYEENVSTHADVMYDEFADSGYGVLSTGERITNHTQRKSVAADIALKDAKRAAAKTETKKDDKFVERRLPKQLKESVYDEGKSVDDIYPGMSTLEKFM